MINEHFILPSVPIHTHKHTHTHTKMDSQEQEYPKGSLVSVLCGNSVGQVMKQGGATCSGSRWHT